MYKILVINPGATSTKIAVYEDEKEIFSKTIYHSTEEISKFDKISEQYEFRKNTILSALEEAGISINSFSAIVGRGGLLKPLAGGTYIVNDKMVEDLVERPRAEHASNLGALIARDIASSIGVPAYIVDPVCVDEFEPIARISGLPEIERESLSHALNLKAMAKRYAKEVGKRYEDLNLIVVHLGSGISVSAHKNGRMIDVNDASAEGPFAPERSGSVPERALVKLCYSGKYTARQMEKKIFGEGGMYAYLGTRDAREVEKMIEEGNEQAKLIYEAMAYQVSKEIGAASTVLKGRVDAIIIGGALAYSSMFISWIKERVSFISKIVLYPGSDEMKALAFGALRVLKGEEEPKIYK